MWWCGGGVVVVVTLWWWRGGGGLVQAATSQNSFFLEDNGSCFEMRACVHGLMKIHFHTPAHMNRHTLPRPSQIVRTNSHLFIRLRANLQCYSPGDTSNHKFIA
jgi:hypothetical protein